MDKLKNTVSLVLASRLAVAVLSAIGGMASVAYPEFFGAFCQ